MKKKTSTDSFATPVCRGIWFNVFNAVDVMNSGKPRFGVGLVLPRAEFDKWWATPVPNLGKSPAQMFAEVVAETYPPGTPQDKWAFTKAGARQVAEITIDDGNLKFPGDEKFKDTVILQPRKQEANGRVQVMQFQDRSPITEPTQLYDGCGVIAVLNMYRNGNYPDSPVSLGLSAVAKVYDDTPWSVSGAAAEVGGVLDSVSLPPELGAMATASAPATNPMGETSSAPAGGMPAGL